MALKPNSGIAIKPVSGKVIKPVPGKEIRSMLSFAKPEKGAEQEEGTVFRPKFDENGLVTALACDAITGEVLMLAHMNAEALAKTIETGKAALLEPFAPGNLAQGRDIRQCATGCGNPHRLRPGRNPVEGYCIRCRCLLPHRKNQLLLSKNCKNVTMRLYW